MLLLELPLGPPAPPAMAEPADDAAADAIGAGKSTVPAAVADEDDVDAIEEDEPAPLSGVTIIADRSLHSEGSICNAVATGVFLPAIRGEAAGAVATGVFLTAISGEAAGAAVGLGTALDEALATGLTDASGAARVSAARA